MLNIRTEKMQQLADAAPGKAVVAPCITTWIEIRLVDQDSKPVGGRRYRVTLPDGRRVFGVLDRYGVARVNGIAPGECTVCFPEIGAREWVPA